MKKILILVMAFVALTMPFKGLASDEQPTSKPIIIDVHQGDNDSTPITHRAPMRISVEAWYDAASETITILYDGYSSGEVFLYRDEELVDNATEINTTLQTCGSGVYTIEIIADSWTATGSITI